MDLKKIYEDDGYQLLITDSKVRVPKDQKSKNKTDEYVSVYLNEEKNDFKIIYSKEPKLSKQIEWTVEDVRSNLEKNHPILQIVNKLQEFADIDNGLNNMQIKPKKVKI